MDIANEKLSSSAWKKYISKIMNILINKYKFKSLKLFNSFLNNLKIIMRNQNKPINPDDRYRFAYKLLNETIWPGFL